MASKLFTPAEPTPDDVANDRLRTLDKIIAYIIKNPQATEAYVDATDLIARIPADSYDDINGRRVIQPAKRVIQLAEETSRAADSLQLKSELYDVRRDLYTLIAPFDFDSFMIAMEWDRDPKARFWLPRRRALEGKHRIATQLQDFMYDDSKFLGFSIGPGLGKLLADNTPVLTRKGWKNHGDLKVGDEVIGLDGKFKKVERVFPKHFANRRVTFANGEVIYCHEDHEWLMYSERNAKARATASIYTTKQMEQKLYTVKSHGNRSYYYSLPKPEPVRGRRKDLPVAPYTFGVWLGCGATMTPMVTRNNADKAVLDRIEKDGYEIGRQWPNGPNRTVTCFHGLRDDLNKIGLCLKNRDVDMYMPEEYLTASIEQRLDLLAGLIDGAGIELRSDKKYQIRITNNGVVEGIKSLLATFGWRYNVYTRSRHVASTGAVSRLQVNFISFYPLMPIPCVRPCWRWDSLATKPERITVRDIEPCRPVQGNCIQVEGGVYLVGHSLIPTHNSTLIKFFLTYAMGREPMSMNMYVSYSTGMINMMIEAVTSMLVGSEYRFRQIFPVQGAPQVSREFSTISYRRKGDFPTLGLVSLGASVTGRTRANRFMVTDDLVKNDEVARSPERLNKLWLDYTSTLTTRTIGDRVKQIMLGTSWSLYDPINRMKAEHEHDPDYKFIAIPIWNEQTEECYFNYDTPDSYTTDSIRTIRETLEPYAFSALYLSRPLEKEGLAFKRDELLRYNGVLPDCEPDRKVFVVDVAWGGGDSLSMPIAYVYGEDAYIVDWLFDRSDKSVTEPRVAGRIMSHELRAGTIEANNGGEGYKDDIDRMLREKNYRCSIRSKKAPGAMAKVEKIEQHAPTIRSFIFLDDDKQSDEYKAAFNELTSFSFIARNLHDDAADSMAQLSDHLSNGTKKASVGTRFM